MVGGVHSPNPLESEPHKDWNDLDDAALATHPHGGEARILAYLHKVADPVQHAEGQKRENIQIFQIFQEGGGGGGALLDPGLVLLPQHLHILQNL